MTDSKKTLDEKCWKGYKKKGMKTMFGKRYPNCVKVKKEGFSDWRSELEQIEEKTKLKNTNYGPAVVYQDNEKTAPARVRQQMPTGGDGTAYMGEKKEPQLPKISKNVKSMNQVTIKPGQTTFGSKTRSFINNILGGVDTSREDQLGKKIVNQAKKSKNSASFRAYKDVVKGTAPRRGLAKLAARAGQAISKNPKGALVAAGLVGTVAAARAIGRKFDQIKKDKKSAAITKQVDKYVADRKAPINKVNYMPDNMYTVKRDEKGKVTGTGDQIRVVPGTRTYKRMSQPGDDKKKSRFSQHTRMKLGNYGSLSPMDEKMDLKKADMGDVITDFRKSDAPQFKGKSDKKIQKMAVAAKLDAMEALDREDVPVIKGIVKKLEGASKKHKNQAVALKKAVEENTAIESELTIQDWNVDEIKYTEVEAVDIIKPEPLKPSPSNWINEIELDEGFKQRIIAKFGKKLIKKIGKVNPFTKTGGQRVTGDVIKKTTPKVKGAFDVTGTQAAQMQRSKAGIKFPVRDATSKQISKNIQTKSIVNQTKKANELGMKKLSNMKGSSGKDLSTPVKVNCLLYTSDAADE